MTNQQNKLFCSFCECVITDTTNYMCSGCGARLKREDFETQDPNIELTSELAEILELQFLNGELDVSECEEEILFNFASGKDLSQDEVFVIKSILKRQK